MADKSKKWTKTHLHQNDSKKNVLGFEESSTTVIKEHEHTHSPPAQSVTVIGIVVCLDS